ncbi:hypothetical protein DUZ99_04800 [Xylanibacillus composti]|uniref:Uncharacterized protein n=1 Tax=Xylanibacillus composti TaxID=1572762 RepID=A0A8J4M243_9BACL|nr:hypothetical protein [Xylanibacillus composti]MDT9724308.1 hypothetical protein [Xylanibacillus composti]GIQ69304.1 hypothetical protein XYCOK13_21280 [Xylanibacillus composti]
MSEQQREMLERINEMQRQLTSTWIDYWREYSSFSTWQFWVNVLMFVVPLVVLFMILDKRRALQIGFFGYSVHVLFTYIDSISHRFGYGQYPYQMVPFTSGNLGLDSSFVPVVYMLLYQWTLAGRRNYYVYGTLLSLLLAFVFKPLISSIHLFEPTNGMRYSHLFLGYMAIMLFSKWVTKLFVWLQGKGANDGSPMKVQ